MKLTNEMVAEKVMGWKFANPQPGRPGYYCAKNKHHGMFVPDFLNDHNAAQLVVEKMREDGYRYEACGLIDHTFKFFSDSSDVPEGLGMNKSLCVAICTAALDAKGVTP